MVTEQEYLVSTSPSDMHRVLESRGLLDEQRCRWFVDACRAAMGFGPWAAILDHAADAEILRQHVGWYIERCSAAPDIIRDIWGNPWRQWHREGDEIWAPMEASGPGQKRGAIHTDWLTWRDATIPKLARAAVETACERCDGLGRHPPSITNVCTTCYGTGRISSSTLDPLKLAVLADALEEAGCCDDGILGHLRGLEKCQNCLPYPKSVNWVTGHLPGGVDPYWVPCSKCNGTGTRPAQHWPGCWVVELFASSVVSGLEVR